VLLMLVIQKKISAAQEIITLISNLTINICNRHQ
jgi:hypothetical protein